VPPPVAVVSAQARARLPRRRAWWLGIDGNCRTDRRDTGRCCHAAGACGWKSAQRGIGPTRRRQWCGINTPRRCRREGLRPRRRRRNRLARSTEIRKAAGCIATRQHKGKNTCRAELQKRLFNRHAVIPHYPPKLYGGHPHNQGPILIFRYRCKPCTGTASTTIINAYHLVDEQQPITRTERLFWD
jgi:hypothetical protein